MKGYNIHNTHTLADNSNVSTTDNKSKMTRLLINSNYEGLDGNKTRTHTTNKYHNFWYADMVTSQLQTSFKVKIE